MDPLAFLRPEDSRKSYLASTLAGAASAAAAPTLRPGLLAGSFSLPSVSLSDTLSDSAWHRTDLSDPPPRPQENAALAKGALQLAGYASATPTVARSSGLYNMF